jgi:flavodoxin
MKLCLIVYYSRTGATEKVASALAQACGADLEQIREIRPRRGITGYLRSAWQVLRGAPAEIALPRHHPADYPVIVLGTPVWGGHLSAPMRSYILQQREHFHRIGLFCTVGDSGGEEVLSAMAAMCNKLPVASLSLHQSDVLSGRHATALADFANQLVTVQHDEQEAAPAGPT